ncbi:hypothetical protein PUR57_18400 [Streptomyces sp. JV176]|uniref:hypothetical protein n=1 Tax=Streptomyces sp. JV176 TaxID=858630 RepID=UPI002E75F346|nr:hypothetical protein [Streptomyces sp. JV176]MEE1800619.1 hypothetical protein [Streptomyces sp. JV176]
MTHSGQGDEPQYPAARPAHEGVVLPSDGSGPWIPGSAADQTPPAPTPVPPALPPTGAHQPGAQPWGQPQQPQPPQQAYGQDPHAPHAPHGAQGIPQGPQQGYGAPAGSPSYDQPYQQPYQQGGQEPYGAYGAPEPTPSYGRPGGAPYDAPQPPQQTYGQPLPPSHAQPLPQQYGETPPYPEPQPYPQSQPPQQYGEPQPPQQGGYGQPMPLPAEAPAPGSADATQYLPPVAAAPGPDADATQFIPPVPPAPAASPSSRGPGVLPPESRDTGADATQFLPPVAAARGSDAEATQFIAPVPAGPAPAAAGPAPYGVRPGAPGDRPPPAEFDNLFRSDGEASGSTQKMPRIETPAPPVGGRRAARGGGAGYQPQPQPQPPSPQYGAHATPGGPGPHEPRGRSAGRRTSSRVPLIAAVTAGIVALGLGAGALMSGGGDDDPSQDDSRTVASATSPPATESTTQAAPDPVKTQAQELDKLLADSSSSRESVINAVNSIRSCDNLGQAATDLHAAAEQRRGLVTRLDALTVDKLPGHTELTSSLTDAWEASASADDHYAAWAKQVGKKKGCKDGQARVTSERSKGDRASGEATAAKKKASGLWNSIATEYELTKRAPTQL